jgi:ABC-2 type transport system permease protein
MNRAYALRDSATMLKRNLLHLRRYPGLSLFPLLMPVVFLLLFVYVFGGTLGNGLEVGGGRDAYVDFLAPGMLIFAVAGAAQIVAISVAMDMTKGIVARFKTMRIWRPSVLAGHVLGNLVLTAASIVVLVAAALLIGYRPTADALEWLAVIGLLLLVAFALTWLSVALGLLSKSVESASNAPMFLLLLPFLGSGFVPVDSMPAGLRWFADNQPFTLITDTLRSLLSHQHVGSEGIWAIAWTLAIAAASFLWAAHLYNRRPSH